jgi:membrane-bound serine protease (ClpP class)
MKALAEVHGKDVDVAERFVTESLTLTAKEAYDEGIADVVVSDLDDLLGAFNLRDADVVVVSPDLRTSTLSLLNNPTVIWLLFIAGFILITLGLFHPTFIGEGVGVISIILALYGLGIVGFSPLVIALLVIGASTIFLELKKGHGALAITGVAISIIAIILIYQEEPFITPRISEYAVALVGFTLAGLAGLYIHKIKEILGLRSAVHDLRRLIGSVGEVRVEITPSKSGVVFLASDLWTATSRKEIKAGERVKVIGLDGLKLIVEKIEESK